MSNVAVPASTGFANLRRAHSEGNDLDITRATASQRAAFNVDKATESNNDTPLTLACSNGHAQMVDVLVCRGANIEHRDKKGFTPLILAATGGHRDVVELLFNSGAQIEAQSERTKDTALSLACSGGRKEVVELLLSRGANKEHRNVSDYTPLSLAASGGYVEIVNMLLNAGAEINSRTGSKLGISSTVPNRFYSANSTCQPENNVLFNQLAAQLLIQQQGVSSTTVPPVQSYYPSPSYTDPAIIGMGHLSTASSGNGGSNTSSGQTAAKSAYTNPYQAASNEYESLNSLLNSSFGHHQNGDFSITHQSCTYPSSPSATRSLTAPRIQPSAGTFVPPPGFGAVASSQIEGCLWSRAQHYGNENR